MELYEPSIYSTNLLLKIFAYVCKKGVERVNVLGLWLLYLEGPACKVSSWLLFGAWILEALLPFLDW